MYMGCCESTEDHILFFPDHEENIDSKHIPISRIETIPLLVGQELAVSNQECGICLEEYKIEQIIDLIECGHYYHSNCLDRWRDKRASQSKGLICPECRAGGTPPL
jgi:hypothetical protein